MKQVNAYRRRMNRYDDAITGRKCWSWLYMRGLWKVNYKTIAQQVLQNIPDNLCGRVLDVPIGSAVFTIDKYKRMKSAKIVGLDYSEEMIQMSQLKKKEREVTNLQLVQGDVLSLPFEDQYFDCVMTMNGLQSFPDNDRAIAEMFRVLKAGGRMCGSFYIKGNNRLADWVAHRILERKGIFIAPHYTWQEAQERLENIFGNNFDAALHGSIVVFNGYKPI